MYLCNLCEEIYRMKLTLLKIPPRILASRVLYAPMYNYENKEINLG